MKQTKTAASSNTTRAAGKPATGGIGTLFEKQNYTWMLIGAGVMILGFILMAGGKSSDPNVFEKDKVYSTTRITIAPIIILAGLVLMIVAIFKQPKNS